MAPCVPYHLSLLLTGLSRTSKGGSPAPYPEGPPLPAAYAADGNASVWKGLRQRCESVLRLQVDRGDRRSIDQCRARSLDARQSEPAPVAPAAAEEAVWSTPELVDAILEENFALRQQVHSHQDNIRKLQKVDTLAFN